MTTPSYKRILLKLSGEALMGDDSYGINRQVIERIVSEIADINGMGVEVAVVIGGGNIFRGMVSAADGMDRASADYMGMLATVMNALALQDAMRRGGLVSRVQSALRIDQIVEPYIRGKAIRYLEAGKVVIFAAGTGNPFFTTDTAAALRKNPDAVSYQKFSFDDAIAQTLKVMDATALTLCRDQKLPLKVFSIFKAGALRRVVMGDDEGTLVEV